MGWCLAIFFLSTLPFLESSATGFATIGWKYYLLFIILPAINVVLLALFCPDVSQPLLYKQHQRFKRIFLIILLPD